MNFLYLLYHTKISNNNFIKCIGINLKNASSNNCIKYF
uniref:Uncharacterized protein n=1 Tax=viral metagenome TaxID=1070528 RepID=A0A6C0ED75_9ZZZZ